MLDCHYMVFLNYHSCQLKTLETPMYKGLVVSDF